MGVGGPRYTIRYLALAAALLITACTLWLVPESPNRGDIFDEASRGVTRFDAQDVRLRLYDGIQREFPPSTPLDDVIGHIEEAGGVCSSSDRISAKPGFETTVCDFESDVYFSEKLFFMGEPTFWLTRNDWTVFVAHSGGSVGWYVVEGQATATQLSRDAYIDGLERQKAEDGRSMQSNMEN